MRSISSFYGKKESQLISGIALISIFVTHIYNLDYILPDNHYTSLISYFGFSTSYYFNWFASFCVSIYGFNSGYSMYINRGSYTFKSYSSILLRLLKFMISYWVIAFLFVLYALIFHEPLPDANVFVANLFGLNLSQNYVCVWFAWYVFFYFVLMLISPIIVFMLKVDGLFKTLIAALLIVVFFFLLQEPDYNSAVLRKAFRSLSVIRAVILGFLIAKYNIFERIEKLIKIDNKLIIFLLLLSVIALRESFSEFRIGAQAVFLLVVPFVYFSVLLFRNLRYPMVENIFLYLGIYSMNLWFLHSIFFVGNMPLQKILYIPQDSFLILVWGIVVLLPLAWMCMYIQRFIISKVFKI